MRNKRREIVPSRFSSLTDEWGTPMDLFREQDRKFNFTLDPCGTKLRLLKEDMTTWTKEDNGLPRSWAGQRVFVNPPFSEMTTWCQKCFAESGRAELIVLLIPVRTDTKYFHEFIYHHSELEFLKGRLQYYPIGVPKDFKEQHPSFASMLCIYRKGKKKTLLDMGCEL